MKPILKLFLVGVLLISVNAFSQTLSREALIEDTLHNFHVNYNFTQKLVDSTSIASTPINNQNLFKSYVRNEIGDFFVRNFQDMLAGTIQSRHLQGSYDDHFNSLKNSTNLISRFNIWKVSLQNHGHSHGAEAGNCDNVDFELGTWQHWSPYMADVDYPFGSTHPIYSIKNLTAGTVLGEHTIITGGNDPNCPALPMLNPRGGTYSLKLGDDNGGYDVSRMVHTAKITAQKPYFTYDFAVVLNDPPSHNINQKPFFTVEFLDSNGAQIPSCGNYDVRADSAIGFIIVGSAGYRYKPWSRITVDLSNYIGQDITVQFTVADCAQGGHSGRAYIDGNCFLPEIHKTQDCKGIYLEADPGYLSYQWFGGTPTAAIPGETNPGFYIPGPGIYKVELISENGCTLLIDTLINSIYVLLNQTITQKDPSCIGVNDGELTINAYGGQAPYTYSIDNGTTIVPTNHFTGLAPGVYTCIVYDSGGCSDTVIYNLTNPPNILPNLVINNTKCFGECNGEVLAVPSGGTSPGGTYSVEFNNVYAPTKRRNNLCVGAHTVKVTDENGCFTINPFVIAEPAQEVIDAVIVQDEQCFNACDGSITINDALAVEYSIDNGATWQSSNVFNNLCAQAGPYQVAMITADGCIAKSTEAMTQPPALVIPTLIDTFICFNTFATMNVTALGGTPPYSFSWSNGATGSVMVESPKVTSPYSVTVTDNNGCTYTDNFSIGLHPQPHVNFTFDPGPETDVFNTEINFTNTTEYGAHLDYEWFISNFTTFNTLHAFYEFPANGGKRFVNCLKAQNAQGCRDSICKELFIKYEVLLFVPNTFTPNDDNVNEEFLPIVEGLKTEGYKFYVFNRWGEIVFSTSDQFEGWDGTYKGKKVKEDTYIWRVVGITQQESADYEKFGHITVLNKL